MALDDGTAAISQRGRRLAGWVALRGFITTMFGLLFMTRPSEGAAVLMGIFSAWCLLDGVLALGAAITGDALRSRALSAIEALLSFAAGVVTWAVPGRVAVAVLFVIAARAMIIGALEIISALRLGHTVPNPWLLGVAGVLSIAFGIALISHPVSGVLALAWLVGLYGIVLGLSELAAAAGLSHFIHDHGLPLRPTMTHG
jgi:uncharacterized membrane protein HdeD (DUF308 family)